MGIINNQNNNGSNNSGLFNLLGSVIGAGINAASANAINQQNIAFQEQANEEMMDFSATQAALANKRNIENYINYHSPMAMVGQYIKAGLSPGLMYNLGGTSGQMAAPMANVPTLGTPNLHQLFNGDLSSVPEVLNMIADTRKKGAEVDEINQEIENYKQDIKESEQRIEKYSQEVNNLKLDEITKQTNNKILELNYKFESETYEERVNTIKLSNELLTTNINKSIEEINGLQIENSKKEEILQSIIDNYNAQTGLYLKQQVLTSVQTTTEKCKQLLMDSEIAKNKEQVNEIKALTAKAKAEEEKIKQNYYADSFKIEKYENGRYYTTDENGVGKLIGVVLDVEEKVVDLVKKAGKKLKDIPNETEIPTATGKGLTPQEQNMFHR